MTEKPALLPPIPAVLAFIDRINHRDVDGMLALMSHGHAFHAAEEPPVTGEAHLRAAWEGYFRAFPAYCVYPIRFAQKGNFVAVLGYTTGSHLNLPDEEERKLLVIWTADVENGRLKTWTVDDDSVERRYLVGLS